MKPSSLMIQLQPVCMLPLTCYTPFTHLPTLLHHLTKELTSGILKVQVRHIFLKWAILFKVVYINKWSTPQEAASWLHEPASMYEVIPSKPISTEEFTAKQLQWECMKAIQAVSVELGFDLSRVWSWGNRVCWAGWTGSGSV